MTGAEALQGTGEQKPHFGEFDERGTLECSIVDQMRVGSGCYFFARWNMRNTEMERVSMLMMANAEMSVRSGGIILGRLFEVDIGHVGKICSELEREQGEYERLPHGGSQLASWVAEGLYEAGERDLAEEVLDTLVHHPDIADKSRVYFQVVDSNAA